MPIFEINNRKPVIDPSSWIAPTAQIIGDVTIGKRCYIGFGAILRGDYGAIIIGDESAIEEGVVIHSNPDDKTVLGKRVTVGHMAMIHNSTIHDNAVIGIQATICDFSEIGPWAIIAEQSLVIKKQKVPGHKIFTGAPATEKRDLSEELKTVWNAGKESYVDLTRQYGDSLKRLD